MKTMNTINMIIPYFGIFPNYFQLFLNSCKYNETITWTIITDNKENYKYPDNVRTVSLKFEELQKRVKEKFEFSVCLEQPYKLCDYKPAYGYLFPEIIEEYDYWGYCDLDVIYGDIRKFLPADMEEYPKLFTLGHFTLIKNEKIYNELFKESIKGELYYRKVFSSMQNFNFDEIFLDRININMIFQEHNFPIFSGQAIADIYTKSSDFLIDLGDGKKEERKKAFFLWDRGKLWRYVKKDGRVSRKEYMYIHLQKRKMTVKIDLSEESSFKIIPNAFEALEVESKEVEEKFNKIRKKRMNLHYFRLRFKNLRIKIKRRILNYKK